MQLTVNSRIEKYFFPHCMHESMGKRQHTNYNVAISKYFLKTLSWILQRQVLFIEYMIPFGLKYLTGLRLGLSGLK